MEAKEISVGMGNFTIKVVKSGSARNILHDSNTTSGRQYSDPATATDPTYPGANPYRISKRKRRDSLLGKRYPK